MRPHAHDAGSSGTPDGGIAVVVVTHCSASTIDECLARLRAARAVTAIRVVDNASTDTTLAIVQRHALADARVRFVANPDNPGFAVACNQGVGELADNMQRGLWLAFVNPDCLVEPDTLARMRAAAGDRRPCLLGADLVDEAGKRDAAARRRDPDFGAMLAGGRSPPAAGRLAVPVDHSRPLQPVDAVSGALMLLSPGLFATTGGFDEAYRLHAEDLDLCRRARAAGALVAVANDVTVVHVRGVSSRARPVFVEWHKHRGLWRYFLKFEAARRGWPVRAMVWTAIWMRFPWVAVRAWARARRAGTCGSPRASVRDGA